MTSSVLTKFGQLIVSTHHAFHHEKRLLFSVFASVIVFPYIGCIEIDHISMLQYFAHCMSIHKWILTSLSVEHFFRSFVSHAIVNIIILFIIIIINWIFLNTYFFFDFDVFVNGKGHQISPNNDTTWSDSHIFRYHLKKKITSNFRINFQTISNHIFILKFFCKKFVKKSSEAHSRIICIINTMKNFWCH